MEFQAVGSRLQSYLSVLAPQLSSGAVGVKTYQMSATFRDFAVYR